MPMTRPKSRRKRLHPTKPVKQLRVFNVAVDEAMESVGKATNVTCSKGCSACCYQLVSMSLVEGLAIMEDLNARPAKMQRFKAVTFPILIKQAELLEGKSPTTVKQWFEMQFPCSFLNTDDGTCRVYKNRPVACRTHAVKSPPENCYNDGRGGAIVARLDNAKMVNLGFKLTHEGLLSEGITPMYGPMPIVLMFAFKLFHEGPAEYMKSIKGTVYENPIEAVAMWAERLGETDVRAEIE